MKTAFPHFDNERIQWDKGFHIIGIDEVGRGPLAGPVTVAGVCFDSSQAADLSTLGINDSKKVPEKKRYTLADIIKSKALAYSVASSDVEYINTYGIVKAIHQAVREAVKNIISLLGNDKTFFLLLDQMSFFEIPSIQPNNMKFIIKGDSISISIAAASIIAKVHRDSLMSKLSEKYPVYAWEKNKGYATADHCEAIKIHSISPYHRSLFVRNICA